MLLEAARRWNIHLGTSVMVGDRGQDIEAGRRAGVRTIFLDHGYAEDLLIPPDHVVAGLPEATALVLKLDQAS